eukprot:scaffold48046_cov57-Phaeocystis_antarctica.AAC.3
MQAVTAAALVRGQLLERIGDETPAVTMLTTTPNDALAHAAETKQSELDPPLEQQRIIASRAHVEPPKSLRPVSSDGLTVGEPTTHLSIQSKSHARTCYSFAQAAATAMPQVFVLRRTSPLLVLLISLSVATATSEPSPPPPPSP